MSRFRNRYLLALDAILLTVSPFAVYALRFEGLDWGPAHTVTAVVFTALTLPIRLGIFYAFGLYKRLWRYASIAELQLIFVAGVTASVVCGVLGFLLPSLGVTAVRVPL